MIKNINSGFSREMMTLYELEIERRKYNKGSRGVERNPAFANLGLTNGNYIIMNGERIPIDGFGEIITKIGDWYEE